jgi:hypothetical protein
VNLDDETMHITRLDNSPLQSANYVTDRRRLVLTRPVAAIAVRRSGEGEIGKVERTPDLGVEDPEGLGEFLVQVVDHLPHAASRKRKAIEQIRLNKLLQGFTED